MTMITHNPAEPPTTSFRLGATLDNTMKHSSKCTPFATWPIHDRGRSKHLWKEKRVLERAPGVLVSSWEYWVLLPTQAGKGVEPRSGAFTPGLQTSQRENVWDASPGVCPSFSDTVSTFSVKTPSAPVRPHSSHPSPPQLKEEKRSLKNQRKPTHRKYLHIKSTWNWFAEWVCRSKWEVILDIEEEMFLKNEDSRGRGCRRQKRGLVTTFGHSRWDRSLSLTDMTWMLISFLRGTKQDRCAGCLPFNYFPSRKEVHKAVVGRFEFLSLLKWPVSYPCSM